MDKITLAEHLLTPVTGAPRASEIIGDLLEAAPSTFTFWLSTARIAVAYSWRWLLAIPAAMFSIFLGITPYVTFVVEPYLRQTLVNMKAPVAYGYHPAPAYMQLGGCIAITGICLWTVAALALVRYGINRGLTRLTCLLATLFTVSACFVERPHAIIVLPAILIAAVGLILLYAPWHRPFLCMAAAGSTFFSGLMGLSTAISFCITHHISIQPMSVFALIGGIACIATEAWILSRTGRWLLPKESSVIN